MPLDPQVRALFDQIAAAGIPPAHTLSPVEARRAARARGALAAGRPEPVAGVEDQRIAGPGGPVPVRTYRPAGSGPLSVLVYFHGGGWVCGDLDSHDSICRALANAGRCVVVSVDYRLAPEHKFPAAAEDAYAATQWVAANAAALDADGTRLAVGGDSAGGNLAAAVALMARDRGGPTLALQLLLYPVMSYAFDTPSYREHGDHFPPSRADMTWYWRHYLASDADGGHPYASPLQAADLRGLAPALVITAEYDPLRDEGEAYVDRLQQAGVPAKASRYDGATHGFIVQAAVIDQGKQALRQAGEALRAAFASTPAAEGAG